MFSSVLNLKRKRKVRRRSNLVPVALSINPADLGFPEKFESFRPAQEEAIEHALTTDKRFVGIGARSVGTGLRASKNEA